MALVLLENVSKVFDGKVAAVSGFSLEVADNEFMVIVGPSGSGKTTTLRMIAGLEKPTSGNIYIADTLVNNVPPKDRDVAMVFQDYALYPHMTVSANMAFALRMRKVPKAQISKRVEDAAKLLGIEHLMNRKPRTLSGGQRQRVAVGKVIVRNPSTFLFDEPFSNLDAKLRLAVRTELKALHPKLQATSIYVTHDQAEAITLGDRICVIHNGMIQQVAAPIEIYERPANKFVAGFFGMPPMNFLDGTIQYKNDKCYFTSSNNAILLPLRLKNTLANCKDQRVVFGIRPEHVSLQPIMGKAENIITCTVTVVEPLGDRIDVYLKSSPNDGLIAKIAPHSDIRAGQPVSVHINVEKSHIFEPGETGKNITMVS
ncbi:MAG: ABC transporter ATP-binding protein [Planctomycetota bacterium]|jgi:multiple sugar transport system ATP-binding protein